MRSLISAPLTPDPSPDPLPRTPMSPNKTTGRGEETGKSCVLQPLLGLISLSLQKLGDQVSAVDSCPLCSAVVEKRQPVVIQAQQMQDGRVYVMHVIWLVDSAQTDLVGSADRLAGLDSAPGHPHSEAPGVVIASIALLVERRAAEFAAPNHQSVFQ